jgi:hypothetical protein
MAASIIAFPDTPTTFASLESGPSNGATFFLRWRLYIGFEQTYKIFQTKCARKTNNESIKTPPTR